MPELLGQRIHASSLARDACSAIFDNGEGTEISTAPYDRSILVVVRCTEASHARRTDDGRRGYSTVEHHPNIFGRSGITFSGLVLEIGHTPSQ